ncbi:MAG: phage/plasmid primase, P4 family [Ruminococcus bromii]|nr:phage/plasmid primase, P4 family [Ruminococcus bromii]
MCRFFDDEESAKEKRQELQPMIQCLPDDIVVLNNTDTIDKGVNQNTPTQISNFEVGNMNQIVSYIPYNCLNIDTMPFTQKHPENAIGWAEIFLKASSTELIYSVDEKVFREWDGRYWKIVTDEEVQKNIIIVQKQYYFHSCNTTFEDDAVKSGNFKSIKDIMEIIKSLIGMQECDFNKVNRCVCVKNGVFSFDTNTLYPHSAYKQCYITYMIDVDYIQGYTDNTFSSFISSIMLDYENAACLQRIYGYPLLGEPNEQLCFILKGNGANGKSTLNNAVQNVVKDLATVIRIEYFTSSTTSNPDAPSPATYQLKDKLYAFTSEGKAGISLNDAQVKKHIGGGKLIARKPYRNLVEFDSKFVLFFDTNHVPHFSEGGYSMERRVIIIPFPATFKGYALNKDMNKLLDSESCKRAMLSWLIEGAIAYKLYGLQFTPRIIDATKQYFLTEDTIGTFFRECIIEDDKGQVTMMELYNAYKLYCDQNLVEAKNKDVFSKSELLKKYPSKRSGKLGRYRIGLRLANEYSNI